MPKGPFVIGFLRSYAECLSLDADEVIAFFQARHGKPAQSPPLQPRQQPSPSRPPLLPSLSWPRGGILGAGLVILLVGLFFVLRSGPSQQQAAQDRLPNNQTGHEPPAARQAIPVSAATPPVSTHSEATAPQVTGPRPPLLRMRLIRLLRRLKQLRSQRTPPKPTRFHPTRQAANPPREQPLNLLPWCFAYKLWKETWIRLDIDEETRQEALIKAGESIEWKANEQFSLTLGNVKGARVLLNEQELDLPATRSNVL
ncbi:hypothetical protein C2W62_33330 [Candidatus Entotheonella serta]|nr:hypothetical protein C2W62_33330 [Candidatus Entotheonella serta]